MMNPKNYTLRAALLLFALSVVATFAAATGFNALASRPSQAVVGADSPAASTGAPSNLAQHVSESRGGFPPASAFPRQ